MNHTVLAKSQNHELELKFETPWLDHRDFVAWCAKTDCLKGYRQTASPDIYYRQGQNVLRFRATNSLERGATLTVKMRTSSRNTADRVEIDIPVRQDVQDEDLKAFLEATGWQPVLHIFKVSHIVDIEDFIFCDGMHSPPVCMALYHVEQKPVDGVVGGLHSTRTFLEVEVEKPHVNDHSKTILKQWEQVLRSAFNVKQPLNQSLYEIYSGRKVPVYRKEKR